MDTNAFSNLERFFGSWVVELVDRRASHEDIARIRRQTFCSSGWALNVDVQALRTTPLCLLWLAHGFVQRFLQSVGVHNRGRQQCPHVLGRPVRSTRFASTLQLEHLEAPLEVVGTVVEYSGLVCGEHHEQFSVDDTASPWRQCW